MNKIIKGFYFIAKSSKSTNPESSAAVWMALFSTLLIVSLVLSIEFLLLKYMSIKFHNLTIFYSSLSLLSAYFFGFFSYARLCKFNLKNNFSENQKKLKITALIYSSISMISLMVAFFLQHIALVKSL